jgi:hypothetical protein
MTCGRASQIVALLLVSAAAGMVVGVPSALGQAAVDQYIPRVDPGSKATAGGGGSGSGSSTGALGEPGAPGSTGAAEAGKQVLGQGGAGVQNAALGPGNTGSAGGVDVPGTDYPLTPFAAVLTGLVVLGVLAALTHRVLARRRERVGPG